MTRAAFKFTGQVLMAAGFGFGPPARAQAGPAAIGLTGTLYQAGGDAVTLSSVNFRVEIWDKNDTCRLYVETHLAQDLSATGGAFSLVIGAGSSVQNFIGGSAQLDQRVFANPGAVAPFAGCTTPLALNAGDQRNVHVYYDLGAGMTALTPSVPVLSSAYAMIAQTLQGKTPDEFLQVNATGSAALSQTNAEYAFSATNWPRLKALLDGTSAQYLNSAPSAPVNENAQRLINLADPTAAQDAATKNYVDTTISGKPLDVTAVGPMTGNGNAIVWDATNNKWTTGSVNASGAAGGDLTGAYPNPNLAAGVVTTAKLADNAVTAGKISTTGIGVNRLVMSDATAGTTLGFATCAQNEILKYDLSTGWTCTSVSSIAPVTSVAGKTGAVSLNAGDIANLGTAALLDYGSAAGQLVRLDGSARLPAVDGSALVNVSATTLQGRAIAATPPNAGQVLGWNQTNSQWEPTSAAVSTQWSTNGSAISYSSGNVGIGTTSPSSPLVISYGTPSTSPTSGALVVGGGVGIGGNVFTSGNLTTTGAITSQFGPITGNSIVAGTGASVGNFATDSSKPMTFTPDGTERLRIAVGGSIGIGTNSPAAGVDIALTGNQSALLIPRDSTANRPTTPVAGMIRYNTTSNAVESYAGGAWVSLATTANAGSVTSVGAGPGLLGGPITTTGSLSVDVGSAAGKIVQESASAQILQLAGSVGAPAYAFASGASTGVYSPGAGQIALAANGTAALNITATGKIGIGTTTPVVALDVVGAVRPGASTAVSACAGGAGGGEGSMRYNYASHFMEYCNGSTWIQITAQAAGAVTPVNVSGPPVNASIYTFSAVTANYTPGFGAVTNTYNGNWPATGASSANNPNCVELDTTSTQQIVYDLGSVKSVGNIYVAAEGAPYGYFQVGLSFSTDGVTYSSSITQYLANAQSIQYAQITLGTAQSARYLKFTNTGYDTGTNHTQNTLCQFAVGP